MGKNVINETYSKQGWGAVAGGATDLLRADFRQALVDKMLANPPNMTALLYSVLQRCPEAATRPGVTIMLGLQYELAAVVPKWVNNFYFAVGTGDLSLDTGDGDTPEFNFNASTAIYTDICAGVGPDVGVELGLTAGIALTGVHEDLSQCGFMFDLDAGVGSAFGLSAGVLSNNVCKFMFSQGMGIGAGIGFTGCGTLKIADLPIG